MIYKWLFDLSPLFPSFNLFQYITFRSFLAFFTSFFVCWFLGHLFISKIGKNNFKERINSDGPSSHEIKGGIPTMGGSFILLGLLAVCFLWVHLFHPLVWGTLLIVFGFSLVGLWDDIIKIKQQNFKGLAPGKRLGLEFAICFIVLFFLIRSGHLSPFCIFLYLKMSVLTWAGLIFCLLSFVITGCANGVNFNGWFGWFGCISRFDLLCLTGCIFLFGRSL